VTVWRWLSEDAIKPWQHRSRIFQPDLEFTEKAGRILDLYSRRWEGELLHPGDYVVSCDEKPSIQPRRRKRRHARCRGSCHARAARRARIRTQRRALLPRRLGRAARQAIRSLSTKDGIVPFDALVEQFMRTEPYSKAQRVFVIVDNGSAHRGQRSINRLQGRYKNLILVRGSVGVVRPPDSSTSASAPSTPAGSTKPRSTSPSPNARSTPPTTSPTSTRSNSNCWRSVAATSRSPPRSNGSSPEPTSTASPTASTYRRQRGLIHQYVGELPSQSTQSADRPARGRSSHAKASGDSWGDPF
jgi:hypothetical protein